VGRPVPHEEDLTVAHELATVNGRTALMYVGEVPWHGLGQRLDAPATAREAIAAADLDYEVELADLATASGIPVPGKKAVVRTDTNDVLGVVGDRYCPIPNRDCFGFLDAIVADGDLRYHTAGALRKGERIWMLAKLPGQIRIRFSDDISERYLLLTNSHDGSSCLRVFFTSIRVVCSNTLAMANREGQGEGVAIRHEGNLVGKVRQAREVLGIASRFFDDLEGQFDLMARHYPTYSQVSAYYKALVPDPEDAHPARAQNTRDELFRLYEAGKGQDILEIRGTTWAAFNAVTEYADHHRPTRGRDDFDRASNRLDSSWFGTGSRLKQRAFRLALEMAASNN
jgi:phage/plasmid-like protein (TIGR03299 family)